MLPLQNLRYNKNDFLWAYRNKINLRIGLITVKVLIIESPWEKRKTTNNLTNLKN